MKTNHYSKFRLKHLKQAGFTLAEMMAVTVLSTLSVTFIYYLFVQQSQIARMQDDIANMQSAVQYSATHLERDLRRAGYMSLIANNDPRLCVPYNYDDFRAIRFTNAAFKSNNTRIKGTYQNQAFDVLNPNLVEADEIEIMANFSTSQDFPAAIDPSSPNAIIVELQDSNVNDERSFKRAFYSPNQLLFVKGLTGMVQIVQIDTSKALSNVYDPTKQRATLSINSNLPLIANRRCGISIRFQVAPLLKVKYQIKQDPNNNNWELWREVLTAQSCNTSGKCTWQPMPADSPHPPLVVSDRVADLQFWFSTANAGGDFNSLDPRCQGDTIPDCQTGAIARIGEDNYTGWPQNDDIRSIVSVYFRLSMHMDREDPDFPFIQRNSLLEPLLTFQINPKVKGSARVRTLSKQIQLVNFLVK